MNKIRENPLKDIREKLALTDARCSVEAALRFVGDRWSLLILREVFYGVRRYDDFLRLTGCSTAVLADRLKKLVDSGILRKETYQAESDRPRLEYRVTSKGMDLLPIIVGLMQWGDKHVAGPEGGPLLLKHRKTGERLHVSLVSESGSVVSPSDSLPTINPAVLRRGGGKRARR